MKVEYIGKHKIELYDSIDELPTDRFFMYNRMLLIDSGIGGDMEAIDSHITKVMRFISMGKNEDAQRELLNMRTSFYFVIENINPKHLSYAALVHSIDGKLMTDISEANLTEILKQFAAWRVERGFIERALEAVKKKFKRNYKPTFQRHSRQQPTKRHTEN